MTRGGLTSEELQNLITISREEIVKNIHDIISNSIPVWRKNIEGIMVPIPVDKLEQYLGENLHEIAFYINKNWKLRVKNNQPSNQNNKLQIPSIIKQLEQYGDVAEQAGRFRKMTIVDREEILDQGLEQLTNIKEHKDKLDLSAIVSMVEIVAYTFYAHHANIEDITESPNLRNNIQGVMGKTRWILSILIDLLRMGMFNFQDFNIIEDISTQSITFDHIIRVLLKFNAFCVFFNYYIDQGLITKNIRAVFKDKYSLYYKKRLDIDNISIESVFKDGIRRIDETNELVDYSMGALLFDMGKLPDLQYHDSVDTNYDEKIVKKHVLNSYNMIMNTNIYPFPVPAMAAFHHELYGSKGGYNFTNAIISKLYKIKRDDTKAHYFITYDEKDFINGLALAYFPIKILEIIDIFDALKNKKKRPVSETLMMMKKEFIIKSLKIDPILFAIYLEFNYKCGLINAKEFEDIDSIIF
jgi:hypothetical protein